MLVIEKTSLYSYCKPSTLFSISLWFYFFIPCLQALCNSVHIRFWILLLSLSLTWLLISRIINSKIFSSNNSPVGDTAAVQADLLSARLKHPLLGLMCLRTLFSLKGFSELLILFHSLYWVKILLRICWILWIPWLTNAYVRMHTDCSTCLHWSHSPWKSRGCWASRFPHTGLQQLQFSWPSHFL